MNDQVNDGLVPAESSTLDMAGSDPNATAVVAAQVRELELGIFMAKKFPRDLTKSWAGLMKEVERPGMAKKASYSYPRGGGRVTGPAVYLARAAARNWGNIRCGFTITHTNEDEVHLIGWAWDLESGTKFTAPAVMKKLIQRKKKGPNGKVTTEWVKPDERNLRELINKAGAIAMRNAILQIIPSDLIDDAILVANKTMEKGIKDPEGEKKNLILKFDKMGVKVEMMRRYLDSEDWTATDLVELNNIYNAIVDGQAKLADYFKPKRPETSENGYSGKLSMEDMKPGDDSTHQGHELPKKATAEGLKEIDEATKDEAPPPEEPHVNKTAEMKAEAQKQKANVAGWCECDPPKDPQHRGVCQKCLKAIQDES